MRAVKINPILESVLIDLVKAHTPIRTIKTGRPPKCTTKEYINGIFYVLKIGIGWDYLNGYPVSGESFRKKFVEWNKLGIFKDAWLITLKIYEKFKIDFEDLFIDASHIKNYLGSEFVGSNVYDRFRKATKLTIIVDEIGVPTSIITGESNKHDLTFMIPAIENIGINIENTNFLIADKGYCSKTLTQQLADIYSIQLITPRKKKKNQVGKTRGRKPKHHNKLNKRYIVEHSFSWFKNYFRLCHRKDRKIANFLAFVYLGASNLTTTKISKYVLT